MRYFKIEEIGEKEYIENTNDTYFEKFESSIVSTDNAVYVATKEDNIDVDVDEFDHEVENDNK